MVVFIIVLEDQFAWQEWPELLSGKESHETHLPSIRTAEPIFRLLGRLYNRQKGRREDNLKQNTSKGQNVPSVNAAEQLAQEHGVSEKTVKRAGAAADAIDNKAANGWLLVRL